MISAEFLKDVNNNFIYDKNGKTITNPLYDQYKKVWPVTEDGRNNSIPPALVIDKKIIFILLIEKGILRLLLWSIWSFKKT